MSFEVLHKRGKMVPINKNNSKLYLVFVLLLIFIFTLLAANVFGDICDNNGFCDANSGEATSNCPGDCPVQCTPPQQSDMFGRNYCALPCGALSGSPHADQGGDSWCGNTREDCVNGLGTNEIETYNSPYSSYDCIWCCKRVVSSAVTVDAVHSPANPTAKDIVTVTVTSSQAVKFLDVNVGSSIQVRTCLDSSTCTFTFRADVYGSTYNYYGTARSQSAAEIGRSQAKTITVGAGTSACGTAGWKEASFFGQSS